LIAKLSCRHFFPSWIWTQKGSAVTKQSIRPENALSPGEDDFTIGSKDIHIFTSWLLNNHFVPLIPLFVIANFILTKS